MESISEVADRLLETVDMVIKDEPKEAVADNRDAIKRGVDLAIRRWKKETGQTLHALAVRAGIHPSQLSRLKSIGAESASDTYQAVCRAAGIDWQAAMEGEAKEIDAQASVATAPRPAGEYTPREMLARLVGTPDEQLITSIMADLLRRRQ